MVRNHFETKLFVKHIKAEKKKLIKDYVEYSLEARGMSSTPP